MTPNPRVLLTRLADGTGVLLHLDTKLYFTLNETGVFVWDQLEGGAADVDALVAALLEEFDVDEATARADVDVLVQQLQAEKLVVA